MTKHLLWPYIGTDNLPKNKRFKESLDLILSTNDKLPFKGKYHTCLKHRLRNVKKISLWSLLFCKIAATSASTGSLCKLHYNVLFLQKCHLTPSLWLRIMKFNRLFPAKESNEKSITEPSGENNLQLDRVHTHESTSIQIGVSCLQRGEGFKECASAIRRRSLLGLHRSGRPALLTAADTSRYSCTTTAPTPVFCSTPPDTSFWYTATWYVCRFQVKTWYSFGLNIDGCNTHTNTGH